MTKKKPKLGPWMPPGVMPVHIGYYQRYWGIPQLVEIPDYWNGEYWELRNSIGKKICRGSSNLWWRGLTEKAI